MLRQRGRRKSERARVHCPAQQRRDPRRLVGRGRALHRLVAEHVVPKRSQRRQEREIDSRAAPLGRRDKFRKRLPLPRNPLRQRLERNRLDVDQVPRRHFARRRPARRNTHPAISHHDRRHAVPRSATDQWVPADLRIVVSMRIDEARRHDQIGRVDRFLGGVGDLADLRDLAVLDRDVGAAAKCAGAVDHRAVFDNQIVGHCQSSEMRFELTDITLGIAGKRDAAQGLRSRRAFFKAPLRRYCGPLLSISHVILTK